MSNDDRARCQRIRANLKAARADVEDLLSLIGTVEFTANKRPRLVWTNDLKRQQETVDSAIADWGTGVAGGLE